VVSGDLWIVVPALNESESIRGVVASLRAAGYEYVCVVDDGSTDATGRIAHESGAYVLRHIVNLGQGASLQTGISFALSRGAQYICTFDADGQHSPDAIATMFQILALRDVDVVLGSRFLGRTVGMPWGRLILLKAALAFTQLHSRLRVTDAHNGLRLLSRKAASEITIGQPGMAHASDILQQVADKGLTYAEVPVTITYSEYSKRKGQPGFEAFKILLDLLYRWMAYRR